MSQWLDSCREVSLARVASEIGVASTSQGLALCPSCQVADRGCNVFLGDRGDRWKCHRCDASGDAIDLVAWAITGGSMQGESAIHVRDWFASRGWCEPSRDYSGPPPRPEPKTAPEGRETQTLKPPPPVEEVMELLHQCKPVHDDEDGKSWLKARLGVDAFEPAGLVGILPSDATLPLWACFGRRSWGELGYRLLFPLVDADGQIRSVRARHPLDLASDTPKTLPPKGYGCRGLVLACGTSKAWLREESRPRVKRLVIAEGEPAWIAWVLATQGQAACMGIFSGSWTPEHARRVPPRTRVVIATDHNDAGDRYAETIRASFRHCPTIRWSPNARS